VLNVTVQLFYNATMYDFGGQSYSIPAKTIKQTVGIENWKFVSIANSLGVVYSWSASEATQCQQFNMQMDESSNVLYFSVDVEGTSMYCQLIPNIIVDGEDNIAQFTYENSQSIMAVIPFFWHYAIVDPNYAVLVGDQPDEYYNQVVTVGCMQEQGGPKSKLLNGKVLIVVLVFVVTILVVVAVVMYPRIRSHFRVLHLKAVDKELGSLKTPSRESLRVGFI